MTTPVVLESARVRAEIDPIRGARLVSLCFDGHEVLGGADDVAAAGESIGTGCYPMVPWAGRVRGLTLHGTGRDAAWEHHGDGRFEADLGAPWPGRAVLTYRLADDALTAELGWLGDGSQGYTLGFHPWFRREVAGAVVVLAAEPTEMVERGDDHLPTGQLVAPAERPWDDCFRLAEPPRLSWPGVLDLELTSDAGWWVIFTEPRTAVCVEPQTAPPDAWNHPALRPPRWSSTVRFTIRAVGNPLQE